MEGDSNTSVETEQAAAVAQSYPEQVASGSVSVELEQRHSPPSEVRNIPPAGANNTTPAGVSNTTLAGASNTPPAGASNTAPAGTSNTAPAGASNTTLPAAFNTSPGARNTPSEARNIPRPRVSRYDYLMGFGSVMYTTPILKNKLVNIVPCNCGYDGDDDSFNCKCCLFCECKKGRKTNVTCCKCDKASISIPCFCCSCCGGCKCVANRRGIMNKREEEPPYRIAGSEKVYYSGYQDLSRSSPKVTFHIE
uniref:Uncharacterized protein n=1 Tax=Strigamia maritima TaxID=126957 RepID=T1IPS5_STRMM